MKKVIPAILLFIFFHSISVAQTVNERIQIVETNDLFYACKIQVAISNDSASLGNAVSRFHYNPDIISFPENPKIVFHNFYDGDYRSSVSHPSPGTVSLNIVNLGGTMRGRVAMLDAGGNIHSESIVERQEKTNWF